MNICLIPNRRNGYTSKQVQTSMGNIGVEPPRDRNGSFEPQIIGKWERKIAPEIENQILTLYGMGNCYQDVE